MLNITRWAGVAQLARASAFQAEGRGFEARLPLQRFLVKTIAHPLIPQAFAQILPEGGSENFEVFCFWS